MASVATFHTSSLVDIISMDVPIFEIKVRPDMTMVDSQKVYGKELQQLIVRFQNIRVFECDQTFEALDEASEILEKYRREGNSVGEIRMGIELALNEFSKKRYDECLKLLDVWAKRCDVLPTSTDFEQQQRHELEMTITFLRLMCYIDLGDINTAYVVLEELKPLVESSRSWSDHWRYWSNCGGFYLRYLTVSNMRSQCPREVTRRIAGFYEKAAEAVQGMVDVGNHLRTSFRCGPTLDAAKVYLDAPGQMSKPLHRNHIHVDEVDLSRAEQLLFRDIEMIRSCPTNTQHWTDKCEAELNFLRGLYHFRQVEFLKTRLHSHCTSAKDQFQKVLEIQALRDDSTEKKLSLEMYQKMQDLCSTLEVTDKK